MFRVCYMQSGKPHGAHAPLRRRRSPVSLSQSPSLLYRFKAFRFIALSLYRLVVLGYAWSHLARSGSTVWVKDEILRQGTLPEH